MKTEHIVIFGCAMLVVSVLAMGSAFERKQSGFGVAFALHAMFWTYWIVFVPAGFPLLSVMGAN